MSGLSSIPVRVASDAGSDAYHGHAIPILYEVRHALEHLIATGEVTQIDLNRIPFSPSDEDRLSALLGIGEVWATIDALGPTTVQETAIPGVWLIDYRNADDQRQALQIEVTAIPEILRTQRAALDTAIATLDQRLTTA